MVLLLYCEKILFKNGFDRLGVGNYCGHLVGDDFFQQEASFINICAFTNRSQTQLQLYAHRSKL